MPGRAVPESGWSGGPHLSRCSGSTCITVSTCCGPRALLAPPQSCRSRPVVSGPLLLYLQCVSARTCASVRWFARV